MFFISLAGPAIPAVTVYPKRSQTSTTDNDLKEEAVQSRKSSSSAVSGRGVTPPSPMLGNANNPNKADIPERKKSSVVPSVSIEVYCVYCILQIYFWNVLELTKEHYECPDVIRQVLTLLLMCMLALSSLLIYFTYVFAYGLPSGQ